jgi:hypothetical protein
MIHPVLRVTHTALRRTSSSLANGALLHAASP